MITKLDTLIDDLLQAHDRRLKADVEKARTALLRALQPEAAAYLKRSQQEQQSREDHDL